MFFTYTYYINKYCATIRILNKIIKNEFYYFCGRKCKYLKRVSRELLEAGRLVLVNMKISF